jgi:hypothetical protein
MSMSIAHYTVSLGLSPSRSFMKEVDASLAALEKKLKNVKFGTNLFSVDQKKLETSLGNALDIASKKVVFEISHFKVNQAALQRAMGNLGGSVGARGMGGNTYVNTKSLSPQEWNRREGVKNAEWTRRREELRIDQANRLAERRPRASSGGLGSGGLGSVGMGGVAGAASRMYAPAIALAGGAYGLSWLNKRNQQVVGAKLQTQAVQQSYGGTAEQGAEAFKWLQSEGDRVGFNWLEAAPEFNQLTSNLQGAGGTLEDSKTVFKGFSEYGRVNKLSNAKQSLVFNALSQIAGKDKLQAEELTKQLGNSLPGAKSLFAEAYQRQKGTRLTGSEAIIALEDAMGRGEVRGDILKLAAQVASERSAAGLSAAAKASQAEQNRFKNAYNTQVERAGEAGVEPGYARLFRAFTVSMVEATPAIEGLAKAFDEISKYVAFGVMLPQSIKRAFEGRDSWVADAMGEANVKMAKDLYEGLASLGSEFKKTLGIAFDGWGLIIEEFGAPLMAFLQKIGDIFLYTFKMLNAMVSGDLNTAANAGRAMTASLNGARPDEVKEIAAKGSSKSYDEWRYGPAANTPRVDTTTLPVPTQIGLVEAARLKEQESLRMQEISKTRQREVGDAARTNSMGVMASPAITAPVKHTMEVIVRAEDIAGAGADTFAYKIANVVQEQIGNIFKQTQVNIPMRE